MRFRSSPHYHCLVASISLGTFGRYMAFATTFEALLWFSTLLCHMSCFTAIETSHVFSSVASLGRLVLALKEGCNIVLRNVIQAYKMFTDKESLSWMSCDSFFAFSSSEVLRRTSSSVSLCQCSGSKSPFRPESSFCCSIFSVAQPFCPIQSC